MYDFYSIFICDYNIETHEKGPIVGMGMNDFAPKRYDQSYEVAIQLPKTAGVCLEK